jgi:crotonobetaine/carnitine-CoA ligase
MTGKLKLLTAERTLPHALSSAATLFGDRISITDGKRNVSFKDLPQLARHTAEILTGLGVKPSDRVMVVAENCFEILQLLIGCAWLNAILVPINPASRGKQLEYFIETTEPQVVFLDEATALEWKVNSTQFLANLNFRRIDDGPLQDESWIPSPEVSNSQPDSTLAILFTSGTTGNPKGVMCPHSQFILWGEVVGNILEISENDIVYTCLPLFHTNALNAYLQCLINGATFHLGPRFSVSQFWRRMKESETTVTYLLGAMVSMLMTSSDTSLDKSHKVRNILAPGTPTLTLVEFEERFGVRLIEAHGMTETNAAIGPINGEQLLGYMGQVLPSFEAKILDNEGNELSDGTPGELYLKCNVEGGFATGYWRMPQESALAWNDGWFRSGDRVVRKDGWYKFVDRIKDVIRRRGENISAWEVEQALQSIDMISVASAIPVPSELGEDEVMAFIVLEPGKSLSEIEILDQCTQLLPRHALPRFIEFVTELPLTETGKIRKVVLRDRGVQATTWDSQKAGYVAKR